MKKVFFLIFLVILLGLVSANVDLIQDEYYPGETIQAYLFNFSSNPTFSTSSDGSFTIGTFFKNPKSYITQIGLYSDANELLAVAKLSKPLLKSFSREALIKIKLDF